jgi:hypothetical protein
VVAQENASIGMLVAVLLPKLFAHEEEFKQGYGKWR